MPHPWRIADHLRTDGQFDSAKRWYHFIFDPAGENIPAANPEFKRVWQFSKFRTEPIKDMRDTLDNAAALDVYRDDPFSPHAIARLRPGAYEKAMVMQYVGNLLEWGDSLFMQFTAESINEATMLYILASDILGPRPPAVGDCGAMVADGQHPKTYETIAPLLRNSHEFILELENLWIGGNIGGGYTGTLQDGSVHAAGVVAFSRNAATAEWAAGPPAGNYGLSRPYAWQQQTPGFWNRSSGTPLAGFQLGGTFGEGGTSLGVQPDPIGPPDNPPPGVGGGLAGGGLVPGGFVPKDIDTQPGLNINNYGRGPVDHGPVTNAQPWQILDTSLAFCIPDNDELLALWDRVELRLYQVRNCMDIAGVRRQPDLFGPPIDPHLLVKMQAEGLSLDDVLNVTSGSVPPYRFPMLLEKARQYAGTVQGFGSALLSALEKRDTESLTQLRTVHEQHLLKMRVQVQQFEVTSAQQTLEALQLQQEAAQFRHDYYSNLSQTGLLPLEITQQVSTHVANASVEAASILGLVGGGLALLPQIGAPTAMSYGGQETSHASWYFAGAIKLLGEVAELVGKSAGIEASFQRRDEEWKHQAALAQREVDQLKRQVTAADIRVKLAQQNLDVHNESISQIEEVFQFYQDRFTSLGLYKQLARTLQTLYRTAFNSASR